MRRSVETTIKISPFGMKPNYIWTFQFQPCVIQTSPAWTPWCCCAGHHPLPLSYHVPPAAAQEGSHTPHILQRKWACKRSGEIFSQELVWIECKSWRKHSNPLFKPYNAGRGGAAQKRVPHIELMYSECIAHNKDQRKIKRKFNQIWLVDKTWMVRAFIIINRDAGKSWGWSLVSQCFF